MSPPQDIGALCNLCTAHYKEVAKHNTPDFYMRSLVSGAQRDQRCILVIKSDSDGFLGLVLGRPVASSGCEEVEEGCGSPAKQEVAPSSFLVQSDLSILPLETEMPLLSL